MTVELSLSVNGRSYPMRCEEEEKAHIEALGQDLDARMRALAKMHGQIGDQRLLLMTALGLIDEHYEIKKSFRKTRNSSLPSEQETGAQVLRESHAQDVARLRAGMAHIMNSASQRLEALCDHLESGDPS